MRKTCNLGVVLLCVAPLALAQETHDGTRRNAAPPIIDGRVFQRLDANGDGRLTREEARIDSAVSAAFDRIDSNGDGTITRAEARQFDDRRGDTPAGHGDTDATPARPATQGNAR